MTFWDFLNMHPWWFTAWLLIICLMVTRGSLVTWIIRKKVE